MKIAVPSKADGTVDEHFGHCHAFAILTLDEAKEIADEETYTPPPGCGCKSNVAETLAERGVGLLIGGNMGEGAANKLRQSGIEVVRGAAGPVRDAVAAWARGDLVDNDELCHDHGGHECHDSLKMA